MSGGNEGAEREGNYLGGFQEGKEEDGSCTGRIVQSERPSGLRGPADWSEENLESKLQCRRPQVPLGALGILGRYTLHHACGPWVNHVPDIFYIFIFLFLNYFHVCF